METKQDNNVSPFGVAKNQFLESRLLPWRCFAVQGALTEETAVEVFVRVFILESTS